MNMKKFTIYFLSVYTIALAAAVLVTFLWNLIGSGKYAVDWATSFIFAFLFGTLQTWRKARENNS